MFHISEAYFRPSQITMLKFDKILNAPVCMEKDKTSLKLKNGKLFISKEEVKLLVQD